MSTTLRMLREPDIGRADQRSIIFHQPDDNVDVADARAFRRLRHTQNAKPFAGNINHAPFALNVKVIVVLCVGIKVRLGAIYR